VTNSALFLAVFLACAVEAVEALRSSRGRHGARLAVVHRRPARGDGHAGRGRRPARTGVCPPFR